MPKEFDIVIIVGSPEEAHEAFPRDWEKVEWPTRPFELKGIYVFVSQGGNIIKEGYDMGGEIGFVSTLGVAQDIKGYQLVANAIRAHYPTRVSSMLVRIH
jgi:hypothetical protein